MVVKAAPQSRRSGPELVGRRDELGALEDELSRAVAGEFRVVLLLGEAGVGKSRLGRELLARHREVTGLVAQAYPLAASAAFGLWTEAVDPFLRPLLRRRGRRAVRRAARRSREPLPSRRARPWRRCPSETLRFRACFKASPG